MGGCLIARSRLGVSYRTVGYVSPSVKPGTANFSSFVTRKVKLTVTSASPSAGLRSGFDDCAVSAAQVAPAVIEGRRIDHRVPRGQLLVHVDAEARPVVGVIVAV